MSRTLLIALFAALFFTFTKNPSDPALKPDATAAGTTVMAAVHPDVASSRLAKTKIENSIKNLYDRMDLSSSHLDFDVFRLAMIGYYGLRQEGALGGKEILTIIDFSRPSTEKRLFTIDLRNMALKYHTYVAHGRNTGGNMASEFSNLPNSNQSSLGFYVTGETYVGSKGYSLRLDGMEKSFNDNIRSRAVVVHGADYVTESWIRRYGRLGRSQGCPALPPEISREVIDAIKGKTAIFTYYPDDAYLKNSQYIKLDSLLENLDEDAVASLSFTALRRS